MKIYTWILFDADETLFHFDAFHGLQKIFSQYGVSFTQEDYQTYQSINKPLWIEYQNDRITAQQLQHQRFIYWAEKLKVSTHDLNSAFMQVMAEICIPLKGAKNLLEMLHGKVKLGIITNGFTELQQARLEQSGLKKYFDLLVISEEVGVAKPNPRIFEYALSLMGNPPKDQVLMVGDNPESDILGGQNCGIHTCWLNSEKASIPEGIRTDYEISTLTQLKNKIRNIYVSTKTATHY